jgi:hypothetical protein
MTFGDYPTKADAQEQAREYATPLNRLINPSDVQDNAEQWADIDDDLLNSECWESAGVITSEHDEMRNLIQDTAFRLWCEDMRRLPRDVLGDAPDRELVMVYQIQPHDMSNAELHGIAHAVFEERNTRIPRGYVEEAREYVEAGLYDGTMPDI